MLALYCQRRQHQGRRRYFRWPALAFVFFLTFHGSFAERIRAIPSNLTARLINLEATSKETFRFSATLHNAASRPVVYNFSAGVPEGWNLVFRVDGMQVTSFRADSGKTQELSIEMTPAPDTKPGKYTVPVKAASDLETLELNLEAVVKGSYGLELTTPSGLLSDDITEGSQKKIHLTVRNTGTLPLDGIDLSAQAPPKWDATFEPQKIERLDPGKTIEVVANLKVPDKTIAGDYVTTFSARNNSTTSSAVFRMTVTTSWLAGWIGVLIILAAIGVIYTLIKKYGRR